MCETPFAHASEPSMRIKLKSKRRNPSKSCTSGGFRGRVEVAAFGPTSMGAHSCHKKNVQGFKQFLRI